MTDIQKDKLQLLKDRMASLSDLGGASMTLFWDRQVYMPGGAVEGRAEQLATISRISHEILTEPETGELLEALEDLDPETDDGALVKVACRSYDKATKLPSRLVEDISRAQSIAEPAWVKARAESDWSSFAPHLETLISLQRESAEHLGYDNHPYDAMIDAYEPGQTKARVTEMFEGLKSGIVPLLGEVYESLDDGLDRSAPLHGEFDERKQEEFGQAVISAFGYDWSRGRQDRTVHPFCAGINANDVRITTRFDPTWLSPALFATFHESGHAMYEQGVNPDYNRTPLAGGTSLGVHESQSRLWENLVGRSRPFWTHYYPGLQKTFPEQLGETNLDTFYRAINAVAPSEIRVEADELTYNLHILLRFELEVAIMEGKLSVADLPEAWNAKMEEYLGVTPENDAQGVLQDIHWAAGLFGYFPTYTIGNVLSVQLFDTATEQHPEIKSQIGNGDFDTLRHWLRENIHQHGSKYEPEDLVQRVTGNPLDAGPYLQYLRSKFGELYGLES